MQSSSFENTPQLVLNPCSQRHINVQPLLKYLNEKRHYSLELKNILNFLFEIKDVLGKFKEYKSA